MSRNQRIKKSLRASGISQEQLAERLGITQAAIGKQLNKEDDIDSLGFIKAVAELTGASFQYLMDGTKSTSPDYVVQNESQLMIMEAKTHEYLVGKTIRPVTVTVDKSGKELITYVPVKAQAGYKSGYGDPHYVEKLPAFTLPMITGGGSYRMFQVDGNSMLQLGGGGLHDGDIVIASYVEDIIELKDNRVYVVVSTEGVLVKRCLNRLKGDVDRVLICNSDNKNGDYPPIILHPNEILEVWELKAYMSRQLSFSTDLWQVLGDIQAEQAIMREKIVDLQRQIPGSN
jgi:transcriptional regulator with XRE-family HTH domain